MSGHKQCGWQQMLGAMPGLGWVGHVIIATLLMVGATTAQAADCPGDCDGNGVVQVDEMVRGVRIALGDAALDECAAMDRNGDGHVTVDELVQAVASLLDGCPADRLAFVSLTDFQTGSFGTLTLDTPRTITPASPQRTTNSDAAARAAGGRVYIVNRFQADNIQTLDPSRDFATVSQCSTGNGSNPHDIALVSATKAYVTRYELTSVLIVNPSVGADCAGFVLGSVDLSQFADADGVPEMDQMAIVNGKLYVSLQRLNRNNAFKPAGPGMIAVIDTVTDTVAGQITLSGENPFGETKGLIVDNGTLVIGEAGQLGVNDGGIERVDLTTGMAAGFFITEAELGGDLNDFVLDSDHLGYAITAGTDFSNSLVAFDPTTHSVTKTL
ncbi:MAG TPA: hypothetical protein VMT89_04330, partial [Candidatus Acidoferrales bacterium]|nr:hypothetical protein [Candidatus Acidoferrales bacterium]